MYSSPIDIFIFVGAAVTSIGLIYLVGYIDDRKTCKMMNVHKKCATHYSRLQARLAVSAGSVRKGYRA